MVMQDDEVQRQLPLLLPRLWRFALRLTRSTADAEDLMQRCCLRALEKRAQWQPGSAMLSWLFSIMHTTWLNELRSLQRRREGNLDGATELDDIEDPSHDGDPEYRLMCRQIVRAVDALPEAQRVVMVLVAVEGFSYREAADIIDVPIGTVMSRLARARLTIGAHFIQSSNSDAASRSHTRTEVRT
jgi:RNA polymerase sigma-70 factor, ECF subfamily